MKKVILMLSVLASMTLCVNLTSCGDDDDDDDAPTAKQDTTNNAADSTSKTTDSEVVAKAKEDAATVASLLPTVISGNADATSISTLQNAISVYQSSDDEYKTAFVAAVSAATGFDEDVIKEKLASFVSGGTTTPVATDSTITSETTTVADATKDGETLAEQLEIATSAVSEAISSANMIQIAALTKQGGNETVTNAVENVRLIAEKYQSADETYKSTIESELDSLTGDEADTFKQILSLSTANDSESFYNSVEALLAAKYIK